jgi:hypothetical protein
MCPDPSLVPPESHHSHHSNSGPPSHATWIFQESCRRTAMVSFFFVSFYTMLREASCSHGIMVGARAWTLGAHLRDARQSLILRWHGQKRTIILFGISTSGRYYRKRLQKISTTLEKAFLVMTQGLDDVRQLYHKQGYKLV